MSSRLPKSRRSGKRMESVKQFFGLGGRRKAKDTARKPRHLSIDPLEQRQLLSVTNGTTLSVQNVSDILVNQTPSDSQTTSANRSVATDHSGDVVVAWTRYDSILDSSGKAITDPLTGSPMLDANIYARYLTNEVQRIVLPASVLSGSGSGYGKFSLIYGGPEVQKISFTTTNPNATAGSFNLQGTYKLGFDLNGNGTIDANEQTGNINFDETSWNSADPTLSNALLMQKALRALGGVLSDVEVQALTSHDYTVTFGPGTAGVNQPTLKVQGFNFNPALAFLPAVQVSTVREPTAVGININSGASTIAVSPTNPALTAMAIENAFNNTTPTESTFVGPVFMDLAPYDGLSTDTMRAPVATVKVTSVKTVDDPLGLRTFDITYVGNSGDQDQHYTYIDPATGKIVYKPLLQFKEIKDKAGTTLTGGTISLMKVCSPEFRVNPPEPSDPFRPLPDGTPNPNKYQQTLPSVAMDADGDFIITWQSEVPDSVTPGSKIDIFAQRYSPAAFVSNPTYWVDTNNDGVIDTTHSIANAFGTVDMPVQGVRPLGNSFRVNTFTVDEQTQPSVGMDSSGNFVISWSNQGQLGSFYNGVMAQRFNRDGDRLGSEFMVNLPNAAHSDTSYTSMSADGHFLIAYVSGGPMIWAKVYDQQGNGYNENNGMWGNFPVSEASQGIDAPSASWDLADNYIIGWDDYLGDGINTTSHDNTGNANRAMLGGVFARMYNLHGDTIRPTFRVNSANVSLTDQAQQATSWPGNQQGNQVALDADGDVTIVYSGFGMDVSEDAVSAVYNSVLTDPANKDLLTYLSPQLPSGLFNSGDIDGEIEEALWTAQGMGATDAQLGRLSAIYAQQADLLRGSSTGVMVSQWNADPTLEGPPLSRILNVNNTETTVNSQRTGQNSRAFIAIQKNASSGSFTVSLMTPYLVNAVNVTINPAYTNGQPPVIDPNGTRDAIAAALRGAAGVGVNWPLPNLESPIKVRLLSAAEETARAGTHWDLANYDPAARFNTTDSYIYEITFQGELHDSLVTVNPAPGDWNKVKLADGQTTAYVDMAAETLGNSGSFLQDPYTDLGLPPNSSIGMQPNGSFTVGWTQTDLYSDRLTPSGNNIYIRTFNEATDTAGPLATDFLLSDGTRLKNNGQVLNPMQYIVVSFDENMNTHVSTDSPSDWAGSVLNPANWALMKDGVQINGGVSQIYFGLNMASQMSAQLGSSIPGSNKYEAVLLLDANGLSAGITPLTDGHYQIVALNSLHDVAGNPLGRTGFLSTDPNNVNGPHIVTDPNNVQITIPGPNGVSYSRTFDVAALTGGETLVNGVPGGTPTGSQTTQTASNKTSSAPSSPHAVANDGNGDYVVVWTDTTPGHEGVWAKMYTTTWVQNGTNHQSVVVPVAVIDPSTNIPWANNEIRISKNPSDTYASVSMDGDGDFVVTWSRDNTSDPVADPHGNASWDVYARRYNALGQPQTDDPFNPTGNEFRVNTETKDIQRYSDVAMSVDGDFVVTWQSMNQDGSGYGVYAQRYSPAGKVLGGTDEIQQLSFVGRPQGTFSLHWFDSNNIEHRIDSIPTPVNNVVTQDYCDNIIKPALVAMGAHVLVTVSSDTTILIQFTGVDGNTNQSLITIPPESITNLTGDSGRRIQVTTVLDGAPGEFRVNDTTVNDQMFPSIATNEKGNFVVTWTGYGQDGDASWESNIYAKVLDSNGTDSRFNITLKFDGGLTSGQQAVFAAAARRWESIITGDVPDVIDPITGVPIDDILIDASGIAIDGPDGILGQAGPDGLRTGSNIPYSATMQFDTADLAAMEADGSLIDVITHEMGHALGFGTVWTNDNLYVNGSGQYTGAAAVAAYRSEFVGQKNATFVPVELGGGNLTADSHWNEVDDGTGPTGIVDSQGRDMENELMTGWLNTPTFISKTTVGQFQDLGYQVNYGAAGIDLPSSRIGPSQVTGTTRILKLPVTYASAQPAVSGGGQEFLVNSTTTNQQKWSSVALDSNGNFVISWTSYGQDGTGSGAGAGVNGMNGVYARKFDSNGNAQGANFKVNTFSANNQQRSQVAMTPGGDFDIVWESFQDTPAFDPTGSSSGLPTSYGVYAQRYAGASNTSPYLGTNREIGSEFRLNTTTAGDQRYPSIAMDANGDLISVWTGVTAADPTKTAVFMQRFDQKTDTTGPYVTDVFDSTAGVTPTARDTIYNNETIASNISSFVVAFDENLSTIGGTGGLNSVINPDNWQLAKSGLPIQNGVSSVQWVYTNPSNANDHRNPATGKFEVLVTFDGDPATTGIQILKQGLYTLTISDNVQDVFGNNLDGDYNGQNGGSYVFNFTIDLNSQGGTPSDDPIGDATAIANAHTFPESARAIATTLNGNHIATWTAYDSALGKDRVYFKVFDADGTEFTDRLAITTSSDTYYDSNGRITNFNSDDQRYATIACDGDGDFVITWTNIHNGDSDVFARRFNAKGVAQGAAFRVNTYTTNDQKWSSVAMDAQGEFIITWSSYGQEDNNQLGKGFGVYARRFNAAGQPSAPEFQVNTTTGGNQQNSSVAMANDGSFFIVWQSDQINGQFDIYGRVFNPDGTPNPTYGTFYTGDLPLNTTTAGNQQYPDVAMNADGSSVVVAWQSSGQDGSGWGIYDIGFNLKTRVYNFAETRVNTTTLGDQQFPSVAMGYNGKFVVTWSGPGSQSGQSDLSGSGVFYREFQSNGTSMLPETRVNKVTVGDQWISSVAVDQRGKAYIVFTGPGTTQGSSTNIYRFIAPDSAALPDNVGPITTDIALDNLSTGQGVPVIDGSVLSQTDLSVAGTQTTSLFVYFSEPLSTDGGVTGQHSLLNKQNWRLYRNGVEISGAVIDVQFGLDASTRKYRAVLTIDGNGLLGGSSTLIAGDYQLVVSDSIWDLAGNALDGDLDGVPGTNPANSSQPGFSFHFTVADNASSGAEIRVNSSSSTSYDKSYSQSIGTGFGREQSRRSVAIDHNGDFATVWTSYGQDDSTDMNGGGVYMRLFDNNNNPREASDILVNTTIHGNQHNATIAMSADGNIIVIWQSDTQDPDGSSGIYGQLFDSMGNKIGTEFRVNTNYTNNQADPAVAADAYGNFVVVWATAAQSNSFFNDVQGQLYDFNGQRVGNEFRVNSLNIPGGSEVHPTVAMNYSGNFVVAWDQISGETNGVTTNTVIMARLFDPLGNPKNIEFKVDNDEKGFLSDPEHIADHHVESANVGGGTETTRRARNPQISMDVNGNFIVVWESYRDNDTISPDPQMPDSYGIYFRRFNADGTAEMPFDHQANLTISALDIRADGTHAEYSLAQSALYAGDQVNPTIAMDVDGDYVIAWDGNGAQPNRLSQSTIAWSSMQDDQGIFSRTFHANDPSFTPEYTSEQTRVNMTAAGSQKFPSIAMTPSGDYVEVWCGNGVGDQNGIFARRYKDPTDTAGPIVTRIAGADGKSVLNVLQNPTYTLDNSSSLLIAGTEGVKYLVVTFDEAMLEGDPATVPDSVTNPANYRLMLQGAAIPLAIDHVEYAKNPTTNKYEAKIFLKQPITTNGTYTLTAFSPKPPSAANPSGSSGLRDKAGNPLSRTGYTDQGADIAGTFQVMAGLPSTVTKPGTPDPNDASLKDIQINSTTLTAETNPKTAANANGDYVVVWVSKANNPQGDIMMQRYDRFGRTLGAESLVSSYQTKQYAAQLPRGPQAQPNVAIDVYGNYVVTWSGQGSDDQMGVYAREFDTYGAAIGEDFRVNQTITGDQTEPDVAIDPNGDVVISWTATSQDGDGAGVYARRYNLLGQVKGDEFLVNTYTQHNQQASQVAMDANGNFAIVWQSDQEDGNSWGIYGQRYNAAGQRLGGEFQVNSYTNDKQNDPQIAMDAAGDFMVAWQSFGQDGSGYGVYARRYSPAGIALENSEFRVNQTTNNWQYAPSISADQKGDFIVVWTSLQNDDPQVSDYGIYAHVYKADGSTYIDPSSSQALNEFRVNIATYGNQTMPSVAMDADGDIFVAFVGLDPTVPHTIPEGNSSLTAIYGRIMVLNPSTYATYVPKSPTGQMSYTPPNTVVNNMVAISGTTGNDTFEVHAGATPSAWTVLVNGVKQSIPASAAGIAIDGLGGNDQLWFYGSASALLGDLWYDHGSLTFGTYTVTYANLEYEAVVGNSGNDSATMHDSAGNDTFSSSPTSSKLASGGLAIFANNFKSVSAQSTQGTDTAVFYDSASGNSAFDVGPSGANFVNASFNTHASGFKNVQAYAAPGKNSTAVLTGTSGDERFIASYIGAQFAGSDYNYWVGSFSSVQGISGGGNDKAVFYGAPGSNTRLTASSTEVTETEPGLTNKATGFAKVEAYGDGGGNNYASLTGSSGAEHLIVSPLGVDLIGTNFEVSAWSYRHATITSGGGADTADVYTSSGADTFSGASTTATLTSGAIDRTVSNFSQVTAHGNAQSTASFFAKPGVTNTFTGSPTQASMSVSGVYNNVAVNFGSNWAYGNAGGSDVANYTDSSGNDFFIASPIGSQMFGSGYNNAAFSFANITAQSTGGSDTSRFYASVNTPDSFVASPSSAVYTGNGFRREAKNFADVEAYGTPGVGSTAQLTGSTAADTFVGSTIGAQLFNSTYRIEAWRFGSVKVDGNGGSDIADLYGAAANNKLAADNVFAEFSGDGFDNRVSNFATTRVHGSTTGTDTAALDHAYLETGLEDQPLDSHGKTILRKLWLYDFDQIATTVKPSQTSPQAVAVDKLMTAFMFE